MSSRPDPTDLVALGRRGLLSEAEERELHVALARDPAVGVAQAVGTAVDHDTAVRAGDDDLVKRAAEAALARVADSGLFPAPEPRPSGFRALRTPARRRGLSVMLAAALVLFTGAAFALWTNGIAARWFGRPVTVQTEPVVVRPTETAKAAPVAPAASAAPDSVVDESGPSAGDNLELPKRPVSRPSGEDAASLFRAANAARRDGAFDRAKRLYSELVQRFPASDEASLARVSLGKLALNTGDPKEAEHEFDQYLKGGHGQLAEEALVSRAESLRRLGRVDAERSTLQRLVAEHPNSVYAAEAKQRLSVLRGSGAGSAP
ncbi:MAG TPA: tetratricopeptide repeat protein [Polyangiaceae bacterium]|nr:tetratricopeptide repeat protein [Polyangiaceae bacterium]